MTLRFVRVEDPTVWGGDPEKFAIDVDGLKRPAELLYAVETVGSTVRVWFLTETLNTGTERQ